MAGKNITFPTKTIAKFLDLTVARVGQLAKEGIITKLPDGKYPASAIPEYVNWLRSRNFGDSLSSGSDLQKSRALESDERRRKLKRENDIQEGIVAPHEILTDALSKTCTQIAAIFDALPLNLKRANPNLTASDIDIVKTEIAKVRNLAAESKLD